jgi:ATP-dependent Zn protease
VFKRNDVEVTAYHEAGHAVMAMAVGLPVTHISIEPNDLSKGSVGWQKTAEFTDEEYRQRAILIQMSGMTADFIHWEKWGARIR